MARSPKVVSRCVVLSFHISKNVKSADPSNYFPPYPCEMSPRALAVLCFIQQTKAGFWEQDFVRAYTIVLCQNPDD